MSAGLSDAILYTVLYKFLSLGEKKDTFLVLCYGFGLEILELQ